MKGKIKNVPPQAMSEESEKMPPKRDANTTVPGGPAQPAGEPSGDRQQPAPAPDECAKKLAEYEDKYLRLLAEYDNYRKRTCREREQVYQAASQDFMRELLPVLDNLDKATEHRNTGVSLEDYVQGIAQIEEQLRGVLHHAGLEPMRVVGQPFDPNLHEAVLQVETDEYEPGTVVREVSRGYTLGGAVLRHAKVVVGT
jgi:molecular chaperone GrpE